MQRKKKKNLFEELWIKIRDLIRSITEISDDYGEKYTKIIKFGSDDNLPLTKMIGTPIVTIVVRAIFHENNNECLYKIYKWYMMIELMFLKESILIKRVHQKSVIFVTISIFEIIVLIFNQGLQ